LAKHIKRFLKIQDASFNIQPRQSDRSFKFRLIINLSFMFSRHNKPVIKYYNFLGRYKQVEQIFKLNSDLFIGFCHYLTLNLTRRNHDWHGKDNNTHR